MRRFAFVPLMMALAVPGLAMAQTDQPGAAPPPAMQTPDAPPPDMPPPGGPWHHDHGAMMKKMQDKFNAANTTHDGHLTLAQAQAAGLRPVVAHFGEIDTAHRGYVTFNEVQAWHMDDMARHLEAKAAALRAEN